MNCSNRSVFWKACIAFLACTAFSGLERLPAQTVATNTVALEGGWDLQSSAKVHVSGDVLSTSGYHPLGWMPISVPTTVVAALVKAKAYPDPTFGTNLRQLPGVEYPIGKNFSTIAMPVSSPFAVSWWYRKQFRLPAATRGRQVELHFEGINYRA